MSDHRILGSVLNNLSGFTQADVLQLFGVLVALMVVGVTLLLMAGRRDDRPRKRKKDSK